MSSSKQYTHLFADTIKIALFMCIKLQAYRESIQILYPAKKGVRNTYTQRHYWKKIHTNMQMK